MKILLFTAAIAAALTAAATACPIRDAKTPQTVIPKRDVRTSASASVTVRWNTSPAPPNIAKATHVRLAPALPPLDTVI